MLKFIRALKLIVGDYFRTLWRHIKGCWTFAYHKLGKIALILASIMTIPLTMFVPQVMVVSVVSTCVFPINDPVVKFVVGLAAFTLAELSILMAAEVVLILGATGCVRFVAQTIHNFQTRLEDEAIREAMPKEHNKSWWKRIREWYKDAKNSPLIKPAEVFA